jgi:lipoprotein-anchoring transpeptidase ErfK/SrfK
VRRNSLRGAVGVVAAAAVLATGCAQASAHTRPGGASTAPAAAPTPTPTPTNAPEQASPADPDAAENCPTTLGRIACVNLTDQIMWVQVGSRVIFGPVHVRTGRAGHVTRTGLWHIYWRDEDHRSSLYGVAMPYSQFFSGGEAFHGLNGESMDTPPGSHGCVNMNTWDARTLWGIIRKGDPVKIFGRKPGT